MDACPIELGTRQGYLLPPFLFNNVLEVVARALSREKEIKGIHVGKKAMKLSQLADDMSLHIENPMEFGKRLLQLINEFSKVTGYNFNTQKSIVLLNTCNKQYKMELRKQFY